MLNKRECAIITAYTGVTMLSGDDLRYLYEYVSELLGHSVQTIELAVLAGEIKEKAKPDFLMLCKLASDEFKEVDVEPVRHGRWIETNDDTKKRCSECDVIHLIAQYPHGNANYCPNCGAKMDGDADA